MTIVSVNQPCYLGWDGYFDRIRQSDLHICLDHVQFEKGSATNRVQIRQSDGRPMWLTVPVEKGKPINETRIAGREWQPKHSKAIWQAYGSTGREWRKFWPDVAIPILGGYTLLNDLLTDQRDRLFRVFRIKTPTLLSSELKPLGVKSELVLNLCRTVDASVYLSGPHGRDYLDLPAFDKAGIEVRFHDYPIVQPVLSALDGLFRAKVPA